MRPLSYTQISQYIACPFCYKLQYIDKLKPKDKWYFSFGQVMHLCAEYFYRVRVPPPPSLPQLLWFYERNWLSEGYESLEEEANYKAYGREILTKFYELHNADFRMPFAVEARFYVDIEGIKLAGKIDRVDKLADGGLSIIDYKTNREPFEVNDLETNLQLALYQLAAEQKWQLPVRKLTLYHLRSNTPFSCAPMNRARLDEVRDLVQKVADGIAGQRFPPIENNYCPCDFEECCPFYMHKYPEKIAEPKDADILAGMTAGEAVERYVSLQTQIKALQVQLEDMRQKLVDYCIAKDLRRVYGKEHAITYHLIERAGFIEEEVRELLGPLGLWEEVLSFDQARVKQLIAGEKLARDARRKLEALSKVMTSYPQLRVKGLAEEEEEE